MFVALLIRHLLLARAVCLRYGILVIYKKHMLDARKAAIESKFLLGGVLPYRGRPEKETVTGDLANCSYKTVSGQLKKQCCKSHRSCCNNAARVQLCACDHVSTENFYGQNGYCDNTSIVAPGANEQGQLVRNVNSGYATEQEGQFVCANKIALRHNHYNLPESIAVTVGSVSFCFRGIDE